MANGAGTIINPLDPCQWDDAGKMRHLTDSYKGVEF